MILLIGFWTFLRAVFFGSAAVALENVALRHQLLVLQRSVGRPCLARWDRVFWVWLSRVWVSWRSSLVIVQPATVLAWHRRGFELYWRSAWSTSTRLLFSECFAGFSEFPAYSGLGGRPTHLWHHYGIGASVRHCPYSQAASRAIMELGRRYEPHDERDPSNA